MVIAMVAVRMMQVALHQVVDMVAVGNRLMAAFRSMHMVFRVGTTVVRGRAGGRVLAVDLQHMLIDVIIVHVMQVAVVQVIGVAVVFDANMAAARSVPMGVALMYIAALGCHG